jgi:hypothetical protein
MNEQIAGFGYKHNKLEIDSWLNRYSILATNGQVLHMSCT